MNMMKRAVLLLLLVAVGANADHHQSDEGAATTPDPCHGLKNKIHVEDLHQFNGEWVLLWSVSNHTDGRSMLANLSSSHVEIHADNDSFIMIERNLYTHDSKCRKYTVNETLHHNDKNTDHAHPTDHADHTDHAHPTNPTNDNDHKTHNDHNDHKTHNHHGDDSIHAHRIKEEVDGHLTDSKEPGELTFYESCPDCLLMTYIWGDAKFLLGYGKHGHHEDPDKVKAAQDDHKQRAVCLELTHDEPYSYDGKAALAHESCAPPTDPPTEHPTEHPTTAAPAS